MTFIRQNSGSSPSHDQTRNKVWCGEGLWSAFGLGLCRLVGLLQIGGKAAVSRGPGGWIFGHGEGCDVCEEVVFPGFQYWNLIFWVTPPFGRQLCGSCRWTSPGSASFPTRSANHVPSHRACLDLHQARSYSSSRTGTCGCSLVSEGKMWRREEGRARLSHWWSIRYQPLLYAGQSEVSFLRVSF